MVEFNPQVQKSTATDVPAVHFPFMSKEISGLTADRSKEFLYSGAGKALESGVNIADKVYDQVVLNDTRKSVDPEEKDYQDRLQSVDASLSGKPSAPGIMDTGSGESLPRDLKQLPAKLEKMDAARANGHFSESEHYQRLVDEATRLRTKYPGKRDLIDSEISRITGVHPANQLIRARLGDINSYMDAAKQAKNKVETMALSALKEGDLDYSMYASWKKGDGKVTDQDILKQINIEGIKKRQHQEKMWKLEEGKGSAEEQQREAEHAAVSDGYNKLDSALDAITISSGVSKVPFREYMDGITSGKYPIPTGEQAEELATNLNIAKQRSISNVRKSWLEVLPGQTKPLGERLGGKMEDYLKKLGDEWDGWITAVKKGDMDIATLAQRQVKAAGATGARELETNEKFGATVRSLQAIKEAFGPEGFQIYMTNNDKAWGLLRDPEQQRSIMDNFQKLVTQPKLMTQSHLETLKKQVEDAKAKGTTGPQGAVFYDSMINFVSDMLGKDISDSVKENVVKGVFGVENQGTVQLFNKDTVNSKGQEVPGQHHVFNTLVSKQSVDHIWKLAKDTNQPALFANTQMWAEHEFSTLLRNDLHDMNTSTVDFSRVEMGYDPKEHKFVAKSTVADTEQRHLMGQGAEQLPGTLIRTLKRVNDSLASMNHIYEKSGQSTDIYLYKLLTASGLDTEIADKMVKSIQAAHQLMKNKEE